MSDPFQRALFVSATGTGVGKTFVSTAIALGLRARGERVVAIKPIETGVPDAAVHTASAQTMSAQTMSAQTTDAELLARACDRPELANAPGLYRVPPPLSPYAATLAGAPPPPSIAALSSTIRSLALDCDALIVEGAGGLLVPLDRDHTFADLAIELGMPVLLVAPNALGVLSHVLTAVESAQRRGLELAAIVLSDHSETRSTDDPSRMHNRMILTERVACPVLAFPFCARDDRALAAAAESSGLLDLAAFGVRAAK